MEWLNYHHLLYFWVVAKEGSIVQASKELRKPRVAGELDDSALAKVLGEAGHGIFATPDVIEEDVRRRYQVQLVGRAEGLRQRFYAISVERKLKHPAVVAICEVARKHIFT